MALREFAQTVANLAVIQKDLPVRSDARKVVSTWRIPHVQSKLGVRLDRLVSRKGRGVRSAQLYGFLPLAWQGNTWRDDKMLFLPYRTYRVPLGN